MSLRSKIAWIVFVAVSLFIGGSYALTRFTFEGRVAEFDEERARATMERILAVLQVKLDDLERASEDVEYGHLGDPATWGTDTVVPVEAGGEPLHVVLAYDAEGWIRMHRIRDPRTGEPIKLRELPNERLSAEHPFVCQPRVGNGGCEWTPGSGIWMTSRGPLAVSLRELESSSGPLRLAIGRFVDEGFLDELRTESDCPVELIGVQNVMLSDEQLEILALTARSSKPVVRNAEGRMGAWAAVSDLQDNVALLLHVDEPSELAGLWREISRDSLVSTLAVAVLFPFVILLLLQAVVTGPLSRLTRHVTEVGRSGDTDQPIGMQRADEIGLLADEFDDMLSKLAESRREVMRAARLAGKSEVSAGVLHNVGNALNSVAVSSNLARTKLRDLTSSDLSLAVEKLAENAGDLATYLTQDPRGRNLVPFLTAIVRDQDARSAAIDAELQELTEGVEQISGLIGTLTSYDDRVEMREEVDLCAQIDGAVELCLQSVASETKVEIARDFTVCPRIQLDRHRLTDVLVHVVLNALQAMESVERPVLSIALRTEDEKTFRLDVSDNGVGIEPENLSRIFAQGYTTREGARGFGLHLAGTVAVELGGRLTASSEGPGHGATFSLFLPARTAPRAALPARRTEPANA